MQVSTIFGGLTMSKYSLHVTMDLSKSLIGIRKWSKEDSPDTSTYFFLCIHSAILLSSCRVSLLCLFLSFFQVLTVHALCCVDCLIK